MISDSLRSYLYFLGFLGTFCFGIRFFLQWFLSEKNKKMMTPRSFWKVSFLANVIMVIHGLIQIQFPICMIQCIHGTLAWRNLNLTGKKPVKLKTLLKILVGVIAIVGLTFILSGFFLQDEFSWMRPPTLPWTGRHKEEANVLWHLFGGGGILLFASRFWLQWYSAEKSRKSELSSSFWWASLIGASVATIYFIRLGDLIYLVSYGFGIIPYMRNLSLLKKGRSRNKPKKGTLFLFAGEKSGDVLGGKLIRSLEAQVPNPVFYGVGGDTMIKAGLKSMVPLHQFQVMGITAVVKKLPKLVLNFHKIKKAILDNPPEAIVLIDYPDFNMRLAKALKKGGYQGKVIQYVCPSVWAWRKKRTKTLSKHLDLLLSILPFEKQCFNKEKLAVKYVGHPLADAIQNYSYDATWKKKCLIDTSKELIALFPGSRKQEIENNLTAQLETLKQLKKTGDFQFAISIADQKLEEKIHSLIEKSGFSEKELVRVPGRWRYELMREARSALATCGTVVLELGLHQTPTVVTYALSPINYYLGRYLFRVLLPAYSLINIISEENVFPEFVHKELDAVATSEALTMLTLEGDARDKAIAKCQEVKELLLQENASKQAAHAISEVLMQDAVPVS